MLALILYGSARRSPRLLDYRPLTAGSRLSVIIPARDEAVNIEPCLRSILATAYAPLEVIVVDDRSSDATAKIVARVSATDPRVRLVRGADLPAGWFGKQWALVQGYRAATGALLLFADADTRHTAELIPRALAVLDAERVDLVTVLPRQEMGSFWERLVQPHVFLALQARVGELRLVNRTRRPWNAIANGTQTRASRRIPNTSNIVPRMRLLLSAARRPRGGPWLCALLAGRLPFSNG